MKTFFQKSFRQLNGSGKRGVVDAHAAELHREVRLDRGGQIYRAACEEAPAAVRELLATEILDGLGLLAAVDPIDQVTEQEVFGGDRGVGLELADPMTVWRLVSEEVGLGAGDGVVEDRHDARW